MSRTTHRTARRENDGYIVHREPRPEPSTREAIRAELSTDRPAVRAALKGTR